MRSYGSFLGFILYVLLLNTNPTNSNNTKADTDTPAHMQFYIAARISTKSGKNNHSLPAVSNTLKL